VGRGGSNDEADADEERCGKVGSGDGDGDGYS
jgi:hypothetical protein